MPKLLSKNSNFGIINKNPPASGIAHDVASCSNIGSVRR